MRKWVSRWQTTLAAVVMWGGFCVVNTLAEQGPDNSTMPPARNVSEFLTPDGRFDLEAARLSGYEGSLDLDDVNLQFDPRFGELGVRPTTALAPTEDPDDIYWDNSISPSFAGIKGDVCAMTVYEGKLVVGGLFWVAGGVVANCIACWDGEAWSTLGSGMDSTVYALTVYNGNLIAAGRFTTAGGTDAGCIASWDGTAWSSLGSGIGGVYNAYVAALSVYDGSLIAGGYFAIAGETSANCIASWDGTTWSPLGSGMNSSVSSLTVHNGNLIAGGSFTTAGGTDARSIASWNGTTWSPLGMGIGAQYSSATVKALIVYNGNLIAGGDFLIAGGTFIRSLASWNGVEWSPLGLGIGNAYTNSSVGALNVYNSNLVVGGGFVIAGGTSANCIASWDGTTWAPLGSGMNGGVSALTVYNGNPIAGGSFTSAGGRPAIAVASWDGVTWSPLGSGMNNTVNALTVYDGKLIAQRDFTAPDGTSSCYVSSWNGTTWTPLGGETRGTVLAFSVYDDKLIAAGTFTEAGGVSANRVASWDGTTWQALGSGTDGPVYALTVYNGNLIAGGEFSLAGGQFTGLIASWNGTSWSRLGSSAFTGTEWVNDLGTYNGNLIAGGRFEYYDEWGYVIAEYVASWDGTAWSRLGEGLGPYSYTWVNALAVYHGRLLAGGEFPGMKSWDGSTWSGTGPGYFTGELDVFNGNLVIAGYHFLVEPSARHIGSWDGTSLSSLGSGTNGSVMALTEYNGNLVVGGSFTIAGGKVSAGLALWTKPCCEGRVGNVNAEGEYPDEITLGDIMMLVDAKFISGDCSMLPCLKEADVNQDGGANPNCDDNVTLGDIMTLVDFLFITGPENAVLPDCL